MKRRGGLRGTEKGGLLLRLPSLSTTPRHSREGTNDSESQRGFCPEVNHLSQHRRPVGLFLRKDDSIRL